MKRLLFLALLVAGCHGKQVPDPKKYEPVNRGTYAYARLNDGEYAVSATNGKSLNQALEEIGCGKQFICLVEHRGDLFDVQQRKKQ